MNDWNPDLYLQYSGQRNQPAKDLLSRITVADVKSVLDYGCGPGNSTFLAGQKWRRAHILGIDSSEAMITKAVAAYPDMEWKLQDIMTWDTDLKFDVVFSNAVIQWIFDHKNLMKKLASLVLPAGAVAFQIPEYADMPVSRVIDEEYHKVCSGDLFSLADIFEFHQGSYYYDVLQEDFGSIEMWQTDYMHEMKSYSDIVTMIESTGLKPYLARIESDQQQKVFLENVAGALQREYHEHANGKVLFPFKRLFVIAYKNR
jgi:trans-aconitate 2-methyltransferase